MKCDNPAWCWALSSGYIEHLSRKRWTLRSVYCSHVELADFFHTRNIVFFHPGDHQVSLLEHLVDYENVICNIGDPSTLKDAERQSAKAKGFSRLSIDFPNIVGGIVDDFSTAVKNARMPVDLMKETYTSLKCSNTSLRLLAVVYTMHLDLDFSAYLPYIDLINLWVWKASDLIDLDKYMEKAKRVFPGKPIHLGLYLYDYGDTCDTLPLNLIQFQFERARKYLEDGRIEGLHLLGSYLKQELHSEQAQWIADCIAKAGQ